MNMDLARRQEGRKAGSNHGLVRVLCRHLPKGTKENSKNLGWDMFQPRINQTRHFPTMSLKHYHLPTHSVWPTCLCTIFYKKKYLNNNPIFFFNFIILYHFRT